MLANLHRQESGIVKKMARSGGPFPRCELTMAREGEKAPKEGGQRGDRRDRGRRNHLFPLRLLIAPNYAPVGLHLPRLETAPHLLGHLAVVAAGRMVVLRSVPDSFFQNELCGPTGGRHFGNACLPRDCAPYPIYQDHKI